MATTVKRWLDVSKQIINPTEAEIILAVSMDVQDRSFFVTHGADKISDEARKKADQMVALRANKVPLAYILGVKWFMGRPFLVNQNVLIPRPETELAAELAGKLYYRIIDGKFNSGEQSDMKKPVTIVDVGTGSGCIGLSVALECTNSQVIGLDISKDALTVARINRDKLGVKNIKFYKSDLLSTILRLKIRPEIIVANLPYVDESWEWQSPELQYEPKLALYADKDGLAQIYRLLDQIKRNYFTVKDLEKLSEAEIQAELETNYVIIESDMSQQQKIIEYAEKLGFELGLKKDLILGFFYPVDKLK